MKILLFLCLFYSSVAFSIDQSIRPYETDYCTAYPEGTRRQPELWKHCCVEHDLYFWSGGSLQDRKDTDLRLRDCIIATGAKVTAQLMYMAVAIGGSSPIRFSTKQWGNAWTDRKRYSDLTEGETADILQYLEKHHPDLPSSLKQSFTEQLHTRLDSK